MSKIYLEDKLRGPAWFDRDSARMVHHIEAHTMGTDTSEQETLYRTRRGTFVLRAKRSGKRASYRVMDDKSLAIWYSRHRLEMPPVLEETFGRLEI